MPTENYDELEWDIDTLPIGSSTPDDLFEFSYSATSNCPMCNKTIEGTAYYHSHTDEIGGGWLSYIEYEDCDCEEEEDDELTDYLKD